MFPSKQEISRSNRRTGGNLSKWESPVQKRRAKTYVPITIRAGIKQSPKHDDAELMLYLD